MKNLKEAQAKVQKEESMLNQLVKRNAKEEVIEAQKNSVKEAKTELEAIENTPVEKAIRSEASTDTLTFCVVKEDGTTDKISKKLAFVKYNRPVDSKRVDKFIYLIAQNKYEKAYPVILAEADKVIANGYEVMDMAGKKVDATEAADYYVILDGQHRCMAFAKLNTAGESYEIPNVYIRDKENIGEYLVEINDASKSWDNKDKFTVAGMTSEEEVFGAISEAIREGINPSAAAKIYTGKTLSNKVLNAALKGEEIILPKGAKFNKERGDKFITLCKEAGMSISLIARRYFIDGFNNHATSIGEEKAFEALKKMQTLPDFQKEIKDVKDGTEFIELLNMAVA